MNYLEWNNAIAKHFFNPDRADQRIWFSVEKEIIEKIAKENNLTVEDFIQAIKEVPDEVKSDSKRNNVCKQANKIFEKWQDNQDLFEYPPYIAYLALFVLAVNHGEDNDFSEINYYGRLNNLLNKNDTDKKISTQDFKPILDLWDDLEKWSLKNKLGEFHLDIYGNHIYVGILYYQVVLTQDDLKEFPEIFWKMGWDSNSHPTDEEILQALKLYKDKLSSRTSKRIEKGKPDFQTALIQRILKQLEEYNEERPSDQKETDTQRGLIDLCLDEIDCTAKQAQFSFRCRRIAGLPQGDFNLKNKNQEWKVSTSSFSVSAPIESFKMEDWTKDFDATSDQYKFHYKGEKYKIFTRADHLEIRGWISGQRYTPDQLFYLAIHKELLDKVQKWGQKQCDECQELPFKEIPQDWHLFKIKGVKDDSLIKKDIPALSIDENPRLQFQGGIRCCKGHQFFDFAPPKVLILGGKEIYTPFYSVNGQKEKLIPDKENQYLFSLPKTIQKGEQVTLIISNDQLSSDKSDIKAQVRLMLVESRLKKFDEYSQKFVMDSFGCFQSKNNAPFLQGAYGPDLQNSQEYLKWPYLSFQVLNKNYLIGEMPGQITVWPNPPDQWSPTWMIQFRTHKKATAYFLGKSKKVSDNSDKFSKKEIKQWKKVIWHKRKRIQVESKSQIQWNKFLKKAQNV